MSIRIDVKCAAHEENCPDDNANEENPDPSAPCPFLLYTRVIDNENCEHYRNSANKCESQAYGHDRVHGENSFRGQTFKNHCATFPHNLHQHLGVEG